ncbi:hypothetical protein Rcae01_01293 [Novipirellula caenicola]|uniref:Uncharacterized protein n=1 Tax=Novipirellula caenicola TaxID=1536901 RepID=A0ABP9VKW9_9BACT
MLFASLCLQGRVPMNSTIDSPFHDSKVSHNATDFHYKDLLLR